MNAAGGTASWKAAGLPAGSRAAQSRSRPAGIPRSDAGSDAVNGWRISDPSIGPRIGSRIGIRIGSRIYMSGPMGARSLPSDFTAIDLIPDFGYPGSDAGCTPWQPGPMLPNAAKCSPNHPNLAQCRMQATAAQRNRSKSVLNANQWSPTFPELSKERRSRGENGRGWSLQPYKVDVPPGRFFSKLVRIQGSRK